MKRTIFTLCFALLSIVNLFAQGDLLLEDFEDGKINFATKVNININPPLSMDTAVVDNPVKDVVNPSNKVWKWQRLNIAAGNQVWAGFWSLLTTPIPAGYNRVEIKYLRTNATSQLRIKIESATASKEIDPVTPASATNTWQTLVFNLANVTEVTTITKFGFFPDYYQPVVANSLVYIDDIIFYRWPTAVGPTLAEKNIIVYYSNGEIRISNYAGRVSVFDIVGRKIAEGDALDGKLKVNLEKGIYIVGTKEGNGKISIQ